MTIAGLIVACAFVGWLIYQIVRCSDAHSRERRHEQDKQYPRYKGDGK